MLNIHKPREMFKQDSDEMFLFLYEDIVACWALRALGVFTGHSVP